MIELSLEKIAGMPGLLVSPNPGACSFAFAWDASVPAGVYAVRLDAGAKTVTRLMSVWE